MSRKWVLLLLVVTFTSSSKSKADWNGLPAKILQSQRLQIVVLPQQGASVVSFYDVAHKKEWLWGLPAKRMSWAKGMPLKYDLAGGIEDAFPTLGEVPPHGMEKGIPMFGQVWNKSWNVDESSPTSLTCSYLSIDPAYLLSKRFLLEDDHLTISYTWKNLASTPQKALWIAHALFRMDKHTHLDLAQGTPMRVHTWIKDGKEMRGGTFSWPIFDLEIPPRDLRTVSSDVRGRSDKFYITEWKQRQITMSDEGESSLTLTFENTIASLGIWLNQKAFPFVGAKFSIIGLEPATSPYEALDEASQNHKVMEALPGESVDWSYAIHLN